MDDATYHALRARIHAARTPEAAEALRRELRERYPADDPDAVALREQLARVAMRRELA